MAETLGIAIAHNSITAAVIDHNGKVQSYHTVDVQDNDDSTVIAAIQAILDVLKKRSNSKPPETIVVSCPNKKQEWTFQSELVSRNVSWRGFTYVINNPLALAEFVHSEPRLLKYRTVGFLELAVGAKTEEGNCLTVIDIFSGHVLDSGEAVDIDNPHHQVFANTPEGAKIIAESIDRLVGTRKRPDLLLVCGSGAQDTLAIDMLEAELEIPVYTAPEPKYTIAMGAALKDTSTIDEGATQSQWRTAVMVTTMIVILLILFSLVGYLMWREHTRPMYIPVTPNITTTVTHEPEISPTPQLPFDPGSIQLPSDTVPMPHFTLPLDPRQSQPTVSASESSSAIAGVPGMVPPSHTVILPPGVSYYPAPIAPSLGNPLMPPPPLPSESPTKPTFTQIKPRYGEPATLPSTYTAPYTPIQGDR